MVSSSSSLPIPSRPIPSRPFPAPSSAAQITWLGEAEGKGVSNAKCLERTVSVVCMIPVSGRSKTQGRKERKEKSQISREMLMPQTSQWMQRHLCILKNLRSSGTPTSCPDVKSRAHFPVRGLPNPFQTYSYTVLTTFQTSQNHFSQNPQSKRNQRWDASTGVYTV